MATGPGQCSRAAHADSALPVCLVSAGTLQALSSGHRPLGIIPAYPACQGSDEILEISWDRQSLAKLVFVLQPQGHRALR